MFEIGKTRVYTPFTSWVDDKQETYGRHVGVVIERKSV